MDRTEPIIISGSSITNDQPWPTWATWVRKLYGLRNVIDVSTKGLGNKAIILNAINQAADRDPGLIVLQLTSVDKWDWYVQNDDKCLSLEKEKHPIFKLNPNELKGFWCTGSHFPLWKKHYLDHYFSMDYQAFDTLVMIQWFKSWCDRFGWKYYIILDSPIFAVPESQLNKQQLEKSQCHSTELISNSLCHTTKINLDGIYLPGLIGYACLHDLPWFHKIFRGHPGTWIHFEFVKNVVANDLDQWFDRKCDFKDFESEAIKYQKLLS